MNSVRRTSLAALAVASLHLVFGAIVRISGSGMGCGDHWPKCYGYWFPPMSRPDLVVEVTHRYLASILVVAVSVMVISAWRQRSETGGSGRGSPLRSAIGALGAVFAAAILGGVTVKLGNAPFATVAHWLVAMTLLALVSTTAIRAGALGGEPTLHQRGSPRTARGATAAAILAIVAVAMGGMTAKFPGAAIACTSFPWCGRNPDVAASAAHIQLTHRTIAVLLLLHLSGMAFMLMRRRSHEAPIVLRAAGVALSLVVAQFVVAATMVLGHLPPVLRSLHEAIGVGIWLACFSFAYLARRAAANHGSEPGVATPEAAALRGSPVARRRPSPVAAK
jgi:cytochrome c oxidase assembly protein subunit 15